MAVTIETLLDEREIHRQLCRLAAIMDSRDWEALGEVVADDAAGNFGEGYDVSGRAGFEAIFRQFLGKCGPTQHLLGNLVVAIEGDAATSRCYVRDMHQGLGERAGLFLSTPGEYRDRWIRTSSGWRLVYRQKINLMMIGSVGALGVDEV